MLVHCHTKSSVKEYLANLAAHTELGVNVPAADHPIFRAAAARALGVNLVVVSSVYIDISPYNQYEKMFFAVLTDRSKHQISRDKLIKNL